MAFRTRSVLSLVVCMLLFAACKKDENTYHQFHDPLPDSFVGPPPGNPDGNYEVPAEARAEDVSNPDQVIGNGTPESCDCDQIVEAVALGGKIVFDCGPAGPLKW